MAATHDAEPGNLRATRRQHTRACGRARATRPLSSRWKRTDGPRTGSASTTGRASPQAAGHAPPASPSVPFCSSSRSVLLTRRHAGACDPNPVPRVVDHTLKMAQSDPLRLRSSRDSPSPTLSLRLRSRDGGHQRAVVISNGQLSMHVLPVGAIIQRLYVPDRHGLVRVRARVRVRYRLRGTEP